MKQETVERVKRFVADREWEQFHTPANLAKSISIEASELLECFQWSEDDYDLEHVKEELADVMVYCLDMLQCLDLDAQVASGGVRDLTEIHEIGALETVEGYHDFQPELVVEQRVDDRKLKCHGS